MIRQNLLPGTSKVITMITLPKGNYFSTYFGKNIPMKYDLSCVPKRKAMHKYDPVNTISIGSVAIKTEN